MASLATLPALASVAQVTGQTGGHRITDIKADGKVTAVDASTGKSFSYQLVVITDGTNATLGLARLD
jgi:hypothetical protein